MVPSSVFSCAVCNVQCGGQRLSVCLDHFPLCFDTGSHWQVPRVCLSLMPPGIGLQMCVAGLDVPCVFGLRVAVLTGATSFINYPASCVAGGPLSYLTSLFTHLGAKAFLWFSLGSFVVPYESLWCTSLKSMAHFKLFSVRCVGRPTAFSEPKIKHEKY